jgi:branched-chain amino acid transport system ATP-binding protein
MTPVLEVRDLRAGYEGQPVVHGLDLTVNAGEIVILAGANGAGKTTTLMTLAGELKPIGGRQQMFGADCRSPAHKRVRSGLGVLPEQRGVFMELSTVANLRLGGGEVDAALEIFPQLRERAKVKAGLLSGGEQQMLALARVLAARPRLILADELSQGLAPVIVRRLLDRLRAAADAGVGVLLVEQHVRLALEVADRAYFLRRGELVLQGSRAELLGRRAEIEQVYL